MKSVEELVKEIFQKLSILRLAHKARPQVSNGGSHERSPEISQ